MDSATIQRLFLETPHNRALGFSIVEVGTGEGVAKLPYGDHLIGNPDMGLVHGGVITTLMDVTCALSIFSTLDAFQPMATLDLRIDYLKPALPRKDIYGYAHCYKRTRNVAFARGVAYHEDRDDPIANAVATFIMSPGITSPGAPQ